jgi:L-lactate dehydrogenase complex protein LldE
LTILIDIIMFNIQVIFQKYNIKKLKFTILNGIFTMQEKRQYPPKPQKVYFFGTCVIDLIYPDAGMAAIQLLEREGLEVIFPQDQSCCGQPAFNSGFPDEARQVAREQIRVFNQDYPIVVPSGSCAGMMRCHYPELFEGTEFQTAAKKFAGRVFELTEFLTRVLEVRLVDLGAPLQVTWHSSCHALREMGVIEDSKSLLRQLKNVELVELQNEKECCGFGGTFSIKHPAISGSMVRDKIDDIQATGAPVVISGDCACLLHITGAAEKRRLPVKGRHIAEFIWERTHA